MNSILEIFKIGYGPSSSHTMGPAKASEIFKKRNPNASHYQCVLYGSLALTGKGHLTDYIIRKSFAPTPVEIVFNYETTFDFHPNAMKFTAYQNKQMMDEWLVFSVGGGSLSDEKHKNLDEEEAVYPHRYMSDILSFCKEKNLSIVEYVKKYEPSNLCEKLQVVLAQMKATVQKGLFTEGYLPGGLKVLRKASSFYQRYLSHPTLENLVYAYALASSEENASGEVVVTAPTCGACAVVPAVILSYQKQENISDGKLIESLMIAGLIGNIVKTNASISGAEVGCQGEVGVACSMAAAALVYLKGGSNNDIEYAAEIALEHHLGMTCDPVDGLVQIPCIERNAVGAMQAYNIASYVQLAGSTHNITFDSVIKVMDETGKDLHAKYRETSTGGLALHKRG